MPSEFSASAHQPASTLQRPPRYAYALAAGLVIVGGMVPRLDAFGRSLSIAEAWVANSVLAKNLYGMFYYERWLQSTPPLFLLLVRATVKVFGLSNYSLRATPFLFGLLALVLFACLAGRMLRPPFAVVALSLLAVSPSAVWQSKFVKQYSTDMAVACLILLVLWEYLQHGDRKRYVWLLLAFAVSIPLSYTAAMFVPLAFCILILGGHASAFSARRGVTVARCAFLFLLTSVLSGLNYFLFIRPNSSSILTKFWQTAGGFPPSHFGADTVHFYLENFLAMGIYFYFPEQSSFKDVLKSVALSLPAYALLAGIVIGLFCAAMLIKTFRGNHAYRYAALFLFVPFLTLMGLNAVGFYPASSRRLVLFMLPSVAILTAASLEALWHAVLAPFFSQRTKEWALDCATAACVIGVLTVGFHPAGWDTDRSEDGGTESAFLYLKSQVQAERDTIYIHALDEEPALLYSKMLHWDNAPVLYGHTGLPCCKRTEETLPKDSLKLAAYVDTDFDKVIRKRSQGNLWLVFTELKQYYNSVDESPIIIGHLYEIGCLKESSQRFQTTLVDEFRCSDSSSQFTSSNGRERLSPRLKQSSWAQGSAAVRVRLRVQSGHEKHRNLN